MTSALLRYALLAAALIGAAAPLRAAAEDLMLPVPLVTLYPGDIYYTGTPEGVGPVKPGDWISLKSLPQLGELKIQVRAHNT